MPIIATLHLPNSEAMHTALREWPSFEAMMEEDSTLDPEDERNTWLSTNKSQRVIEVTRFLLLEDCYGHKSRQSKADSAFWGKFTGEEVMLPEDMPEDDGLPSKIPSYFASLLGKLNVPFLRWVKHLAVSQNAEIYLHYEHERGDNLYESANWAFYYATSRPVLEEFLIADYDGDQLQAQMWRMADHRILKDIKKISP